MINARPAYAVRTGLIVENRRDDEDVLCVMNCSLLFKFKDICFIAPIADECLKKDTRGDGNSPLSGPLKIKKALKGKPINALYFY